LMISFSVKLSSPVTMDALVTSTTKRGAGDEREGNGG
jgi:hypothetical protein